ncbi:chemerin-like receptor 1 [Dendropsophus ebraccatus]|uniref:chemerin-like receptor 1 n=1 Tax=Dendropsophus ebraccatus TaxID=150705 RepID=UPI003831D673
MQKTKIMEATTRFVSLENASYPEYTDYYNEKHSVSKSNVQYSNHTSMMYRDIGFMAVYSALCLLGVIGNGLVIWFAIFRMKKKVTVLWFLSLAVADFSFALFSPLNFTQRFLGNVGFNIMCKLIDFSLYINMVASVLQITVISIDRCLCVVFPVWCHNQRRPRLAYIIVLTIWMIGFVWSMVNIMYSRVTEINNKMVCAENTNEPGFAGKTVLQFVFFFLLPFIIIVSCYIVIVLYVKRRHIVISSRPLKTIGAVVVAFFICWFPGHLLFLTFISETNVSVSYVDHYLYFVAVLLVILNSCINPVLYVLIGRDFKEKFCGSFQAMLEKAFIEDTKSGSVRQERSTTLQSLDQDLEEKSHGMNRI